jgi:Ca2+-binding RTX toxin-like protein
MASFVGKKGDDNLTGTKNDDTFDLSKGGHDAVHALAGNDVIAFGKTFDAHDRIDGGDGSDKIVLSGNIDVTLGAHTLVSVEEIDLAGGYDYRLVTNDGTVAANAHLTIDGSNLANGDTLTVDGSAETDGRLSLTGGDGNDALTGGAQNDSIADSNGSNVLVGGGGNDQITVYSFNGNNGLGQNILDGGDGNDSLYGGGGKNTLDGGTGDDNINSNGRDTIRGGTGFDKLNISFSDVSHSIAFDASDPAATAKIAGMGVSIRGIEQFNLTLGDENDTITLGLGDDRIDARGGDNTLHGGAGDDSLYVYTGGTSLLDGGAGNDHLSDIYGLQGAIGHNTLLGGAGDDELSVSKHDVIDGGSGWDQAQLLFNQTISDVRFNGSDPSTTVTVKGWGGTSITGVESFQISGADGDDRITGGVGDDEIFDSGGDDVLAGGGGNDYIIDMAGIGAAKGGAGDDILGNTSAGSPGYGSTGVVAIDGGSGIDGVYLSSTSGGDLVFHEQSASKVTKLVGDGTTVVNVENIYFYGGLNNNTDVRTAGGDDILWGGGKTNILNGGGGNDELHGDGFNGGVDAHNTLTGGDGDDLLFGGQNADTLNGGQGDDIIHIDYGCNGGQIDGGSGNDSAVINFTMGGSVFSFDGAGATATLTDSDNNVMATAVNVENYTVTTFGGTLTGGDGDDVLTGGLQTNGGGGDDILMPEIGGAADGGDGNDRAVLHFSGSAAVDFEFAGVDATTTESASGTTVIHVENFDIVGGDGDDELATGAGSDKLNGGTGSNTLDGGAGDDTLTASYGDDTFTGGAGIDTVSYNDPNFSTSSVAANLETGTASGWGNDTFSGIENLTGGVYEDALTGDAHNNVLDGGFGSYHNAPLYSSDILTGGGGDDTLILEAGGLGRLDGGAGSDTASIDGSLFSAFSFTFNDATKVGSADVITGLGITTTAVENIHITGSIWADHLSTGSGTDTILGGSGDDVLYAAGGDDTLNGGMGADVLASGGGFDKVVYAGAADSTNAGSDTVVGFNTHFDHFVMPTAVTVIDASVSGSLDGVNFTSSMESTIGASALGAHHALLFNVTGGAYAGKTFLIVDANGQVGYQEGGDYVIVLQSPAHISDLAADNFTVG